ncbi:Phosphopantetheine attachment site [Chitinophaga rupis]|uniref:Phosphopantetheine attachment site n=1 Tax=Chitinophaga rupis TaxID=573321 RepID=A0A1H8ED88_9BACT|nr:non-ribosomal peptide synthetase [Chitinophaga rupis]SEN17443.1 Phosphopantetheine attachment site [Chitinophaga rupis]
MRIIIVTNRLPFTLQENEGKLQLVNSAGGLVSGMRAFLDIARNPQMAGCEVIWVGWPGMVISAAQEPQAHALMDLNTYVPVWLSDKMVRQYYLGYCNEVIWPLFHGFHDAVTRSGDYWPAYEEVNDLYAAVLKNVIHDGDLVWIHDYHLMCLPALLRKQGHNIRISFFLHIPFPDNSCMSRLPGAEQAAILNGLSGADLIGFNAEEYTQHFKQWQSLNRDMPFSAAIATFPIGIDTAVFKDTAGLPSVQQHTAAIRASVQQCRIILSVNRLDIIKGLKQQLIAFRRLLQECPQWRQQVVLQLVVVPSREGLPRNSILKQEIEELVAAICNEFSAPGYSPVQYYFEQYSIPELIAFFAAADVALVVPIKDGMNLVSKEYVASRINGSGTLVLSRQAGASQQLKDALLVDAFDTNSICRALHTALNMDAATQHDRMVRLQTAVTAFDIFDWGNSIIAQTMRPEMNTSAAAFTDTEQTTLAHRLQQLAHREDIGVTFINGAAQEVYLSYRTLYKKALHALYQLQQRGLDQGSQLVLHVDDNECFLVAFWACMLGGIIAVPLATGSQSDHRIKLFSIYEKLTNARLLTDAQHMERLQEFAADGPFAAVAADITASMILPEVLLYEEGSGRPVAVTLQDTAYIQYSSGSTGAPNGVVLTHGNLWTNTGDISTRSAITAEDRMLSWMPLSHDMGLICFHLTGVYAGISQYIMPTALFIRRPALWLEKATRHSASLLYSPNFGYHYFLAAFNPAGANLALNKVRIIYNGAEPISVDLINRFMEALQPFGLSSSAMFPGYGLAEASVAVTLPNPGDAVRCRYLLRNRLGIGDKVVEAVNTAGDQAIAFLEVGYAIPRCSIRICNGEDELLEDDHVGHIQIKGGNVTSGYYNNPAAGKKLFTKDGWLRTGDLGLMKQGRLYVTGRFKQMIIIRGQNYYPQDIERIAHTVAGIEQGKVVACAGSNDGEEQLLLFILSKEEMTKFASLATAVKKQLLDALGIVPDQVIPVRKIPKTTSGKVQHFKLLEQYNTGEFNEQLNALRQLQLQQAAAVKENRAALLLDCCRQVFADGTIELHTNLMQYGAGSLQLTQLAAIINSTLYTNIQVHDIFSHAIIADLLQFINGMPQQELPVIPAARGGRHPLSPAQHRFWMYDQYGYNRTAYNICGAYLLQGDVQAEVLAAAVNNVVQRHHALQMVFNTEGEHVYQQVKAMQVPLEVTDRRSAAWDAQQIADFGKELAAMVFDLQHGPLMKVVLVQTGEAHFALYIVLHHIIADGWSFNLLLQEIKAFYTAGLEGKASLLPAPAVQYEDFVTWQQQQWQLEAARLKAYWHAQLANLPPVLKLQATHITDNNAAIDCSLYFDIDPALVSSLSDLCRQQESSLFMGLMAVLNILFYKYTGQTDQVLGTDIAGREHPQLAGSIGCFTNTLCIRNTFSAADHFLQILEQVRENMVAAFAHQLYPFDQLLNELTTARDVRHNGLFDILVLMQPFEESSFSLAPHITATPVNIPADNSYIDLLIEFVPQANGLQMKLRYNAARYEAWQMAGIHEHFEVLLTAIAAAPATPISELDLLQTGAAAQYMQNACGLVTAPVGSRYIQALFLQQCAVHPQKTAILCGGNAFSYEWLEQNSCRLAIILQNSYNITPGARVGILMERSQWAIVTLMAILRTGAVYVPVDPAWPAARKAYVIEDAALSLICCDAVAAMNVVTAVPHLEVEQLLNREWEPAALPEHAVQAGELAYIMYTSGSTGVPKGVMIGREALNSYVAGFAGYFNITAVDIVIQQASLAFDTAVEEIFPALCTGATIRIIPQGGHGIEEMLQHIQSGGVTVLSSTPHVISEINAGSQSFGNLRLVISGGDVLRPAHINRLLGQVPVYNTYGPTETTVCATYQLITQGWETALIGKPVPNSEVYILNAQGRQQAPGISGEIGIAGAGLAAGYLHAENEEGKFIFHPFRPGRRLYLTGDLGYCTPEGSVVFTGRKDEQLKIRGYRVETAEIIAALLQYPGIKEAEVVEHRAENENWLNAFVTGTPGLDITRIRLHLGAALPFYMIPANIIQLDVFPMLPNGKVNRQQLMDTPLSPAADYAAPRTDMEKTLVAIWEQVLQTGNIGIYDNFFQLGGQSIRATQIISRIRQQLQLEITLKDIFTCQHIALLATLAAQAPVNIVTPLVSVSAAAFYVAAPVQRRLWLTSRQEGHALVNNLCWAYRLEGGLRPDVLQKALQHIIARYEILRTVFRMQDGMLQQVVLPVIPAYATLKDIPAAVQEAVAVRSLLDEERNLPFDLEKGPLLRMVLAKHGETFIFILTVHHIITDAWSMELIQDELVKYYRIFAAGDTPETTMPALQYKDYADWINRFGSSMEMTAGRGYWKQLLAGELPELNLQAGTPRYLVNDKKGARWPSVLQTETVQRFKTTCYNNHTSLFTGLLAVTQLLLHKYSGLEDIITGIPVNGRVHDSLEAMPGCFINLLPLRTGIEPQHSFNQLLAHVNDRLQEAYRYQWVPFEQIVEDVNPARAAGRHPLFNILVNWRSVDDNKLQLEQLHPGIVQVSPLQQEALHAEYDLSFNFLEKSGVLELSIEYNEHLFTEERIRRMGLHFSNLLHAAATSPETAVTALTYLDEQEKQQVLYGFNNTAVSYEGCTTLPQQLAAAALERQNEVALICGAEQLTYHTLEGESNRLANLLIAGGIRKGDLVGIFMERGIEFIISILAILKTGAAYVPADREYPQERVRQILESCGVKVLITDDTAARYEKIPQQYQWEQLVKLLPDYADVFAPVTVAAEDLAYIMYTSGSTGLPKGVMITHGAVIDYVQTFRHHFNLQAGDVVLQQSSVSFDTSIEEIFPILCSGGRLLVLPAGGKDITGMVNAIREHAVTIVSVTPLILEALNKQADKLHTLRLIITGGDVLQLRHADKLTGRFELYNTYGPVESTVCATYQQVSSPADINSIGRPIANRRIYITDSRLQLQGIGVPGEICIAGNGLALGYLAAADYNVARFIDHPFPGETRLYRTGDKGYWREDGSIVFCGRMDRQLKINGYRIEPAEIEKVLLQYPGVTTAIVTPQPQEKGSALLYAYVTGAETLQESSIRNYLRKQLPYYMLPAVIMVLDVLPLTRHGKPDVAALPVLSGTAGAQAPLTPTAAALMQLWMNVLEVTDLHITDNFFIKGGHSLKAMHLLTAIAAAFGVKLPFESIFLYPTIAEMAGVIDTSLRSQVTEIPAAPVQKHYPLSPAQKRLWLLDQLSVNKRVYNMAAGFRLNGVLDVNAFRRAWETVLQRQDSLRTVFPVIDGQPRQQILEEILVDTFIHQDISAAPDIEAVITTHVQAERERIFQLDKGPLVSMTLLQTGAESHLLLFNMHHIISDGHSCDLLMQEVVTLYNQYSSGLQPSLPALPVQYRDVACWQLQALDSGLFDAHRQYWLHTFARPWQPLQLPADVTAPAVSLHMGSTVRLQMGAATLDALTQVAADRGGTLFMVLLTTVKMLLFRYTAQEDIVIGCPVAGRNYPGLAAPIGCFVNTLPLRTRLSDTLIFDELFEQVKKVTLAGLEHQQYPLDYLVDELGTTQHIPLFNVMMLLDELPPHGSTLHNMHHIQVSEYEIPSGASKCDLTFTFSRKHNNLELVLEYDTALFNKGTIQLMGQRYLQLLQVLLTAPETVLSAYSLLTPEEQALQENTANLLINFQID